MNQDILDICIKLNKNPQDIIINSYKSKKKITYYEMVEALLETGSSTKAAEKLQVTIRTISRATPKFGLPKLNGGSENFKYKLYLLINKKNCGNCNTIKAISDFYSDKSSSTGLFAICKICSNNRFKEWYKNNSEQHNANTKARQRKQDRALTCKEIQFVFDRDGSKCQNCGITNEEHLINQGQNLHFDHIYPLSKGGLTIVDNMQLLCRSCNSSKKDKA